ncbi:hypothetical protein [Vitreimonas flagellata]|uniref:hypothetical protein n=1 Tax=Vitreimonas flagellata TaxID=2560861 RepID=UPI00107506EC|nr:hypothetical protein [Vitreimonas flagellata]
MTNERAPIPVVTALELIRKRPEMFFDAESPRMDQLIELVVEDVTAASNSVEYRVETSEHFTVKPPTLIGCERTERVRDDDRVKSPRVA